MTMNMGILVSQVLRSTGYIHSFGWFLGIDDKELFAQMGFIDKRNTQYCINAFMQ
jgi:hypothetical protein